MVGALCFAAVEASAQTEIARASLAPAGRHVALETVTGERHALAIFDNDNAEADARVFNLSGQTIERLAWANDRYLLVFTSQLGPGRMRGSERDAVGMMELNGRPVDLNSTTFTSVYALDTTTMRAVQLLADTRSVAFTNSLDDVVSLAPAANNRVIMLAPIWVDDPSLGTAQVVQRNPYNRAPIRGIGGSDAFVGKRGAPALWSVDLANGRGEMMGEPDVDTVSWVIDSRGATLARLEYANNGYALVRSDNNRHVNVQIPNDDFRVRVIGAREDNRTIEISGASGPDEAARELWLLDLETGALTPQSQSISSLVFHERTGLVAGVRSDRGVSWRDAHHANVQQQLSDAFGGAPLRLVSSSANGQRHVFLVRDGETENYYYYDAVAARADILGASVD